MHAIGISLSQALGTNLSRPGIDVMCGGPWSEDAANLKNLTPRYSVHMDMQLISALPLMFRYEAVMGYLGIQD